MNVLYYIPDLLRSWGGVKQYSIALLKILTLDEVNTYYIYHNAKDAEIEGIVKNSPRLTIISDDIFKKQQNFLHPERVKAAINKAVRIMKFNFQFKHQPLLDLICAKYAVDVIHCPYQYTPIAGGVKLISTMHDVQELHFPEYFTPEMRLHRASIYWNNIRHSNKIVVSYDHVKNDLIKYFQIPAGKIHTVLLNMNNLWYAKYFEKPLKDLKRLNLPSKFLLYPANTWVHKNHTKLLQAIKYLKDEYLLELHVVCTGDLNDYFYKTIQPLQNELGLTGNVSFLNVVDEETLYALYKSCVGVIVPTTYEAGSFPLMESILMKVPVICSNITSLPETVGDDQFIFDPFSIPSIATKAKQLWECEEFRSNSIENSYRVEKNLKETGALSKIQDLYSAILKTGTIANLTKEVA